MDYCDHVHQRAKADLATCFVERCLSFCSLTGSSAVVTPQNWLFLGRYKALRETLLSLNEWKHVGRLGTGAFETISGEIVNVALLVMEKRSPCPDSMLTGLDVSAQSIPAQKAAGLLDSEIFSTLQSGQRNNPDSAIILESRSDVELLCEFGNAWQGVATSDIPRFQRCFWEVARISGGWHTLQSTVDRAMPYGGREAILFWQDGFGAITEVCQAGAIFRGKSAWGRKGVVISQMTNLAPTLYSGDKFDCNCAVITLNDVKDLPSLWCYVESGEYTREVRKINKKLNVTNSVLSKIPFDLEHWRSVAAQKYPNGLPQPFSNDPTQWLFNGHPSSSDHPLHVALARLLGYQWPRQTGSSFLDCPALAHDDLEALTDQDGIVCLSPIRGEAAASDRLRGMLAASFGDEWSNAKERELLLEAAVANDARKAAADLGEWLRQNFFAEHCKLFQSRPFVWQIWDGNPHGFSALVNYHKLAAPNGQGRKTLELLTYTYLGDWIDRQKLDQAEGVNGADDRLAAALDLQGQLKKILDGEPPFDLFVRWKPLHQQAIGWDPDINDGVRLNIRPFLKAQLRKGGKAGAGILRAKPGTIKWSKDRGKEPMRSKDDFPWFWGWDETNHALETDFGAPIPGAPPAGDSFDGNRWNDLHYSRAAKEAARAKKRGEA